jgi:hypothetical protein
MLGRLQESEEDCALWVTGLRTLLEIRRGDARGQEVGRFLWARARMKTSSREHSEGRSHMQFLAEQVRLLPHRLVFSQEFSELCILAFANECKIVLAGQACS